MSSLEDAIRRRAYELWEAEGRPEGRTDEFWYRAEEEVTTTNAPTAENPAARKRTASGTPATKKSSGKTTKSEGKATPASNAKPRAKTGARKTSSATGQATARPPRPNPQARRAGPGKPPPRVTPEAAPLHTALANTDSSDAAPNRHRVAVKTVTRPVRGLAQGAVSVARHVEDGP